jgi:abequosyltransferase
MVPSPRLSLCIPTFNRARYLRSALESGLREAASLPPGVVEVVVCDNASTDGTQELISLVQQTHPGLRAFRNDENIGFDPNYLRCVEEARGEFVWVLGDDDVWLPGSAARVLRELDAGADACLCLAETCDLELNPKRIPQWYRAPDPPAVWKLEGPEDLALYFDTCAFNAGAFAFISVSVFRRDRFLKNRDPERRDILSGYIHVWSMMRSFRQPLRLHYIPEALVKNREGDSTYEGAAIFDRLMVDFRHLGQIADAVFGDVPKVHDSFSRIIGRNHEDGFNVLPWIRLTAPSQAAWTEAIPFLVRAGYAPTRIAAVESGVQMMHGREFPTQLRDHGTRPFVDLSLLAERGENTAILALGGLQNLIPGAALLAALRRSEGRRIRIYCPMDCREILDGFEVRGLDPRRYAQDALYKESIVTDLLDFAPGLAVNLDPARGIEADDLMAYVCPPGALAYEVPHPDLDASLVKAVNAGYTCLVPRHADADALLKVLGLETAPPILWPTAAAGEEARSILARLGWNPAKTLVLLVDDPSMLEDPAFQGALVQSASAPWTLLGLGGKRVGYQSMETLLAPWSSKSVNLTGALGLGPTAALLQLCGGFLGGTPLLQSMARACGCAPVLRDHPGPPGPSPGGRT